MSISNTDLIADALRELGIVSEIATPSAEQGAHALRKLNQMMAEWETNGINIGYFAQSTLSDTCPIPDDAENGVTCQLALRLASNYGATVSAELAKAASDGYDRILHQAVSIALPEAELTNLPGYAGGLPYNILTDI